MPARKTSKKPAEPLHPRLQRLNQELGIDRIKDVDNTLYASRDGFRFNVTVHRHPRFGFVATAKIAGRLQSYEGKTPAEAFLSLTHGLGWVVRRLAAERNESEFQNLQSA